MKKQKRAQAAAAAALLVIIVGLIILYILFIPPSEREKILGEDENGNGYFPSAEENETLLEAQPGRIDFISQKKIEHAIPTTHIFTRTEGLVLEKKASLYVKKSLFSSLETNMSFIISDLANTENVILSAAINEGSGRLIILLNEEEIFNEEIEGGNLPPIELNKRYLKTDNILHFKVSSPGAAFWKTNEYSLANVQVSADVTSVEARSSKNLFLISATEFNNLERVELKFEPDCTSDSSRLDIWVNQYNIYSAVPDCGGGRVTLEFAPTYLRIGENELIFQIDRGDYYLSHIAVESELKTIDFPVYYFELSEEQFGEVEEGEKEVILRMDFVDITEDKRGELIVNGHLNGFDTDEISYTMDISDDVVRGNNGIQIKPQKTLNIRELTVILASSE